MTRKKADQKRAGFYAKFEVKQGSYRACFAFPDVPDALWDGPVPFAEVVKHYEATEVVPASSKPDSETFKK